MEKMVRVKMWIFSLILLILLNPNFDLFLYRKSCRRTLDLSTKRVIREIQDWGTKVWVDTAKPEDVARASDLGATGGTSNPKLVADAILSDPGKARREITRLIEKYQSPEFSQRLRRMGEIYNMAGIRYSDNDLLVKMICLELTGDLIENALNNFTGPMSWEVDPRFYNSAEAMVSEAKLIYEIAQERGLDVGRIYIKIPATKAGLDAAEKLIREGINVNLTLVFTIAQGLEGLRRYYAAKAESKDNMAKMCISPFLGRWDDFLKREGVVIEDGNGTPIAGIYFAKLLHQKLLEESGDGERPEIIMASIRSVHHVQQLIGADILTIPPKILFSPEFSTIVASRPTIGDSIDPELVKRLLQQGLFAKSMRDIHEGGFTVEEFDGHPLVVEGNDKFIQPYKELLDLLVQLMP